MTALCVHILALAVAAEPAQLPKPSREPSQVPSNIVPPKVLEAPSAVYPLGRHESAEVDLRILVDTTGQVAQVEVVQGAGVDFDSAARTAVLTWRFAPATLNGVPFGARLRIPFVFQPPPELNAASDAGLPVDALPSPTDAGAPLPTVSAVPAPTPAESAPTTPSAGPEVVSVRGVQREVFRGGGDFTIDAPVYAATKGPNAGKMLELAPGIFIANEGGAGHADQVFLRGFDAEQGQAIEFTVNGVPINQVDNPDGHGYADTHFIIPEVVKNLRVIEGPFDPHQGDFAEAGSADYELGVTERKLLAQVQYGSFNTERALVLWAPEGQREGTFAAVQALQSDGYGVNRANSDASAIAQYEGELGERGLWRLLGTAYATHYKSAGVLRADDVANSAIGFYGSEDTSQGGDAQHYSLSLQLVDPTTSGGTLTQQAFVIYNEDRILEDFTGFLLDPQLPGQSQHPERGDGILQQYSAFTAGARGADRLEGKFFGLSQAIEFGYYARYDHTAPVIQRVKFGTQIPYRFDEDLTTDVFNLAGYIDLELHPWHSVTLRGGVRQEYFDYNVQNLCQLPGQYVPHSGLIDVTCGNLDPEGGVRLPDQRTTATALVTEPKVTALWDLPAHLSLSGSYGMGVQSLDAVYISQQDLQAPFAQIQATEGGVLYHRRGEAWDTSARAIYYFTHVGQDLQFNPNLGRLSQSSGTTRQGAVAALRIQSHWFDESASFTYAHATEDSDHTLVPYVPSIVARSDTAITGHLPLRLFDHPLLGTAGVGLSLVGTRALPLGQSASPTFTVDTSASVRWQFLKLSLSIQNLTDSRYPLSEFFYASDFHHQPYPTLTPVEHVTAAPPFFALLGLAVILDKESRP